MAWALTQSGFSRLLAETMAGLPGGAPMFMAVSILAFVVLGSVLEGIRPLVGYMVALLIGTIIVAAVPWISIGFL